MMITHDTTIEQYEAWLATNPSMSTLRRAWRGLTSATVACIGRIKRSLKKKQRSCISQSFKGRVVVPDERHYDDHAGWREFIRRARLRISGHLNRHEAFEALADNEHTASIYAQRHQRLAARLNEELAMEELYESALTLLTK